MSDLWRRITFSIWPRMQDPAYLAMLAMRMQRMEAGRKVTLDHAERIH
jgi:hypothetical protein